MSTHTYRHDTVPCSVLDRMARLPPDEQVARLTIWDVYAIQARKAQIHLEMRMEMLREEEEERESQRA